jgi:hypothetical protein
VIVGYVMMEKNMYSFHIKKIAVIGITIDTPYAPTIIKKTTQENGKIAKNVKIPSS